MDIQSLAEDKPNLVCPECGRQFNKMDLRQFDKSDHNSFIDDSECPGCRVDLHPEDALFTYFRAIPTAEITGRPTQIGGFATMGTIELDVGKTKEIGLIGGGAIDIDLQLLAKTRQPSGLTMQQLQGNA